LANPLTRHFTFPKNDQLQNDLLAMSLHLAAGQHRRLNHHAAMALLLHKLAEARADDTLLRPEEFDILLGRDLNASTYDRQGGRVFEELNSRERAVLAGVTYPTTRVAGIPLNLTSQIDYLVVTRKTATGLLGEEVTNLQGWIHEQLTDQDRNTLHRRLSDLVSALRGWPITNPAAESALGHTW
ncbi:MAG: hypothetical protein ACE5IM_07945, partial [Nitrospinota bacterium]